MEPFCESEKVKGYQWLNEDGGIAGTVAGRVVVRFNCQLAKTGP